MFPVSALLLGVLLTACAPTASAVKKPAPAPPAAVAAPVPNRPSQQKLREIKRQLDTISRTLREGNGT